MIKTFYPENTPQNLIDILEKLRDNRNTRVEIMYETVYEDGQLTLSYSEKGYVGRSTGSKPIPLIVHNRRSLGGSSITVEKIVLICELAGSKKVLYRKS